MRRIIPFIILMAIPYAGFSQVIPCNCECSGRLELVSGNGFYLLDSISYYAWDTNTSGWHLSSTSTYRYNDLYRKISNTGYRNEKITGERIPSYRIDYRYGDQDEKRGYLNYRWNSGEERWVLNQQIELNYDKDLKLKTQLVKRPAEKGNDPENLFRAEYTYHVKGVDEIFEKEKWDPVSKTWKKIFRTTYIKEGPSITAISFSMKNGSWIPVSRTVSVNNDKGVLSETYNDQYDPNDREWKSLSSATYYFNEKGNKTEWISRGEDRLTKKNVIRGHQRYLYDDEGKLSEVLGISESAATKTEQYHSKKVYHWSLHSISGLHGEISGQLKIFPNPFKYHTTIELPEPAKRIDILDSQGRILRTYTDVTDPTFQIDKRDLRPAIYILKVYGKQVYTGRLVIY